MDIITGPALFAFLQIFMINLMMSGDNAIIIGMTAARVAPENRHKVIFGGLAFAVVLRIGLSLVAVQLLNIIGLTLAGGIILLWLAWRLYRDIRESKREKVAVEAMVDDEKGDLAAARRPVVPLSRAIWQVIVADISMSVDNVLAVAGAARGHIVVLVVGLVLSVAFMGAGATIIAKMLERYHWLNYVGVLLILFVALQMIWGGGFEVMDHF